ncbi:MAG TPA: bifunctional 3-deoxy-7-phosphoheptulonate synthase/chorismate mutase [Candidatus Limnocylindria bacterium]|nr:bifunctional 3-deoxy-7-phosphoheptulonate synthase/chorismate mutase [Candidatus Limnocylindria bacterium]
MRPSATSDEVEGVKRSIEEHGLEAFLSVGEERTVIGVVGDVERISHLGTLPGVDQVIRVSTPYKLASIQEPGERTRIRIGAVEIGLGSELVVMAGPCAVESREQLLETARCVRREGARILRGGAYKPRTSPYSFQGLGVPALKLLAQARGETGLPIISEVVDPADVEIFDEHVDILQVGARNMQNFALLKAVGQSRHAVLLKRGVSATIEEWLLAAEYVLAAGNPSVILCERGIRTFETATRNTLDLSAVPVLRSRTHLPIVVDPSHGTGHRDLVGPMALAGAAVGADGLLIEVHPDPTNARSDGDQSLAFDEFGALMDELRRLQFVRSSADERAPLPDERPVVASGIDELRAQIDDMDARLADLVQERAAVALEVQRRRGPHAHGHDVRRERDLLERAANGTPGPMTPVELTMVFDAVLRASRSVQRRHAQSLALGDDAAVGNDR